MLTPPINKLIDMTGSRYSLVIASAKRARQIIEGYQPLIEVDSIQPVSIATEELYRKKIESVEAVDSEIAKAFLLTPSEDVLNAEEEAIEDGEGASSVLITE